MCFSPYLGGGGGAPKGSRAQPANAVFPPQQLKMEISETDFFDTLTIQSDQISHVKHVLAPFYVIFTLFGCGGGLGWVGLGQGLIRTSGTTDIALPCASQLVRRVHGCPVSRPTGLMTAPVPRGGTRGREMPPCLCVWGSVSPGAPGPGGEAGGA